MAAIAAAGGICASAGPAWAAWLPTDAGTYDYLATENWEDGNIDGDFPATLTLAGAQTLTFSAPHTTSGSLNFNYAGDFSMTLRGDGNQTLTLGGDVIVNTTGSANVVIGSATANQNLNVNLGGANRTFNVAAARTLTLSNVVSNGGIIKTGAGTLTLSGANTYSGGTAINGGTLTVTNNAHLGDAAGSLSFDGGILRLGGQDSGGFSLGSRPVTINAGGATLRSYRNSGTYTFSGDITGVGQLNIGGGIEWGTPVYVLSGDNSYASTRFLNQSAVLELRGPTAAGSGPITLDDGYAGRTLRLRNDESATFAFDGVTTRVDMTIDVNRIGATATNQTLTIKSLTMSPRDQKDIINVTGGNGYRLAINSVTLNSSWTDKQLAFNPTTANLTVGTIEINKGQVFLSGTSSDNRVTGVISGFNNGTGEPLGNLIKEGSSTWTLEGASTYYGKTDVRGGTLLVNGSIASQRATTVSSGATLGGTGSIAGPVVVNAGGTLAPGASIESLAVGSAVINGILRIEIDDSDPLQVDLLQVAGALDITNATVDFDVTGTLGQPFYVFATYGEGQLTGEFAPERIVDLPDGYEIVYNYQGLNQIALVVPEPASAGLLLGLGAALLARRGRRA